MNNLKHAFSCGWKHLLFSWPFCYQGTAQKDLQIPTSLTIMQIIPSFTYLILFYCLALLLSFLLMTRIDCKDGYGSASMMWPWSFLHTMKCVGWLSELSILEGIKKKWEDENFADFYGHEPSMQSMGRDKTPPEKVVFPALTPGSAHSNTHHGVQRLASTTVALKQWNAKHSLWISCLYGRPGALGKIIRVDATMESSSLGSCLGTHHKLNSALIQH